jgi:hypothetical protein
MNDKRDKFIEKAYLKFGDTYSYAKVVYLGHKHKVTITCPIHGDFEQLPDKHIRSPVGCPKCSFIIKNKNRIKDNSYFVSKASQVHSNKYSYSKINYTSCRDHLTIICPEHGEFSQLASAHLAGYGCKQCSLVGRGRVNKGLPATLYYLYYPDYNLYKIGVTSKQLKHRFRYTKCRYEVLFEKYYTNGEDAFKKEQEILHEYTNYRYVGSKVLPTGNTELFTEDVLKGQY